MRIRLNKNEWYYIILLLILSFAIQFFVNLKGGESFELFSVFIGVMMFLPAILALIFLFRSNEGLRYINWGLGRPIYLILGLTIPAVITLGSVMLFEKMGLGTNTYFELVGDEVFVSRNLFLLGNQKQTFIFFILNFLVTGISYSMVTSLVTIGEEIGWRGYLQKKLMEQNPIYKSLFFLGLLWGFWHLPLILGGYNYPEYPVLGGMLLFPLTTIFASFFLGLLTLKGRSIWPSVFAHGGVNSIMTVLHAMEFGENKLVANMAILGIWALVGLVSLLLLKSQKA